MGNGMSLAHMAGHEGTPLAGSRQIAVAAAPPAASRAYEFIGHDAALTPIRIRLSRSRALALSRLYTTQ